MATASVRPREGRRGEQSGIDTMSACTPTSESHCGGLVLHPGDERSAGPAALARYRIEWRAPAGFSVPRGGHRNMSAPAGATTKDHHFTSPEIVAQDHIGCCGKLRRAVLGRFLMFEDVYSLQLWADELSAVEKNYAEVKLDERKIATRYLCWRRSVLGCALLPYTLSLALRLKTLFGSLDKADFLSSISPDTDLIDVEEYYTYFEPYFYVHVGVQVLYAASLVLSLLLMAIAWRTWANFQTSRGWLRASYLLSFAVPYLVLLIAPYKQAIDGAGAELKLCQDMLERGNQSLHDARFACSMPDASMCKKPAEMWAPVVIQTLDDCGVVRDPTTGTCPFAARYADRALEQNSLAASDLDPAIQRLCEDRRGCLPCIEPEDPNSGGLTCTNLALAVAGPSSVREHCARCFEPIAEWRSPSPPTVSLAAQRWAALEAAGVGTAGDRRACAQVCAPLLVPGLSADYAARLSGERSFCVGDETVAVINSVTMLALHFDKIEHAVGVFQALVTLATLFPASFSLMFGSIKGSTLCKTLLPWSRLPGYMIGAAIVFCLPMFMALLAVVYQLVGDWYCMLAFFSLLFSLIIWLPMGDLSHEDETGDGTKGIDRSGVLAPQSHTAASAEFLCRGRISNLFKFCTVVFIVLFVLDFTEELDQHEREEAKDLLKGSFSDLTPIVLGVVFDVFGKSYLAFLFCADVTTEIIAYISLGDDSDKPVSHTAVTKQVDPRELRKMEMADIRTLRADSSYRKNVASGAPANFTESTPPNRSGQLSRKPPPLRKP